MNPTSQAGGFRCELCNVSFTVYDAYLDHCNSKLHQRNLGTPTIERVDDVERIRTRLAMLREKRLKGRPTSEEVVKGVEERIAQRKLEDEQRRRSKKEQKRQEPSREKQPEDEESKLMSSVLGITSFK